MEEIANKIIEYNTNYWFRDFKHEEQLAKELEEAIMTEFYTYLYNEMYNYIVFQIKFWIYLFLIFQLVYVLIDYYEKRSIQPPYDEETRKKIKEQLQIGMIKSYMDIRNIIQLLPEEEKEEALEELETLIRD